MTRNGVCSLTSTAVDERVEHQPHKGAFSETTTNCIHHVCKVSLTNCRPKVTSNVVLSSLSRRCPPSNGNKPSLHITFPWRKNNIQVVSATWSFYYTLSLCNKFVMELSGCVLYGRKWCCFSSLLEIFD